MIERRRYERVQFLCDASVTALPNGAAIAARTLDISLGGVGLLTRTVLEPGQAIAVSFSLRDSTQKEIKEQAFGRVVAFRADLEGNRVGVEFSEPLNESRNPELVRRLMKI
jgi:c-di-GMP-binding flagellar brake protein YcgR